MMGPESALAAASGDAAGYGDAARRARVRFARVSLFAAAYTYLLVVFGGVVRITGSGLGCGDDWPKCNGQWIPTFDLETFIEWFHRLLAAGLLIPFLAMFVVAAAHRRVPGFAGPGGLLRPAGAAIVLLVVQALLGALTVRLELEAASVTVMHFAMASVLLAVLLVAAIRAGAFQGRSAGEPAGAPGEDARRARKFARSAVAAAALGLLVLVMGAFTANLGKTPGAAGAGPAAWACGVVDGSFLRSFPLCNGQWIPEGGGLVHVHWTHRLLAFLLLFHVLGAVIVAWRRGAAPPVRWAATVSLALIVLQVAVAAKLILMYLPLSLQVAHLVIGTAIWSALVVWAALARRAAHGIAQSARSPAPAESRGQA